MSILKAFANKQFVIIISLTIFLCVLAGLPLPWNTTIEDVLVDLRFMIRGSRQLSDEFLLVFIGPEDLQALGGWPLTRDYYGYLLYLLKQKENYAVGFDLLFDMPDARYPEYDARLADFIQASQHVCLPLAFSELAPSEKFHPTFSYITNEGIDPIFPIPEFKAHLAGMGFSNLGSETLMRRVPLIALHADSLHLAYSVQLAQVFLKIPPDSVKLTDAGLLFQVPDRKNFQIPLDKYGQIRLNHFGNYDNVNAMSLIDLLQEFQIRPDSLKLEGKLILVAVTAPGIASLKTTPLASALPASLIQLTIAENIVKQNFLREISCFWIWPVVFLLAGILWLINRRYPKIWFLVLGSVILLSIYWLVAILLFSFLNMNLPLFYPTLIGLMITGLLIWFRVQKREETFSQQKDLLETEISTKQNQLEAAEKRLEEMQNQLAQTTTEKAELTSRQEAELSAQQKLVAELEKQLADLQTYHIPEKVEIAAGDFPIVHAAQSKMRQVLELVQRISRDDIPVLILGDTGTGKEVVARAMHASSRRKKAPFVPVNCGALSETLLESELFGHEKGSFTGAQTQRRGRFELANGGTLFLDEITETSPNFQAKLLRVLQEGTFERLGSEKTLKVDVRVIAASNKNIQEAVAAEKFRADLFYRLNGFPIQIPPLRERIEDIPLLAAYFLKKYEYKAIENFSSRAMDLLKNYGWPGNVRELENVVRRAAILAQSEGRKLIQVEDLPPEIQQQTLPELSKPILSIEDQILEVLRHFKFSHSSIQETAQALGNKDRGTITEYFRGICFQFLVEADFDIDQAARNIANTDDEKVISQVKTKLEGYLKKLEPFHGDYSESDEKNLPSTFKGLPKKYHGYLVEILKHRL